MRKTDCTVIYYSNNMVPEKLQELCFEQLKQACRGMELLTFTTKPLTGAEHNEIFIPATTDWYLTTYEHQLNGIAKASNDIVFIAEDDCLYPRDHFESMPVFLESFPDKIIYNKNSYHLNYKGFFPTISYCNFTSMLCAYKDILEQAVLRKMAEYKEHRNLIWCEPGVDRDSKDAIFEAQGHVPVIDIRHGLNGTGMREPENGVYLSELPAWGSLSNIRDIIEPPEVKIQEKFGRALPSGYREYIEHQMENVVFESEHLGCKNGQRYAIEHLFKDIDRKARIADIACGDGVSFEKFQEMGFESVVGVELHPEKAKIASSYGYLVYSLDIHHLKNAGLEEVDILYSSHTLEHAFNVSSVLKGFQKLLKPGGLLFLVLPYVDSHITNTWNHCGKYQLGLHIDDGGETVRDYIEAHGFDIISSERHSVREPEIWIKARRR